MPPSALAQPPRIEIALKPEVTDARGNGVAHAIRTHLGLEVEAVRTWDVFTFEGDFSDEELERIRAEFTDPVIQRSAVGRLADPEPFDWMIRVGFKPGVTDNVGRTARGVLADILGRPVDLAPGRPAQVRTSTAYLLRAPGMTREEAEQVARDLLANLLIETVQVIDRTAWELEAAVESELEQGGLADGGSGACATAAAASAASQPAAAPVARISLAGDDADLVRISTEGTLSLTLAEMQAIRDYFRREASEPDRGRARRALGLDERPTDIELEMVAQTWSEHCKHKIFSGTVHYEDLEAGTHRTIKSLFKTFVRATTEQVAERVDWLVSVFHDNAGVIAFNDRMDLVYKVETHNSPSALEPYGGAMTGIVGCNRDPLGTGLGAELLINVWGYCFASPATPAGRIPDGVMHPRRLRDGVHRGVIDGGNQSGIPYGVGWEFFDDRYLAKPMVYCGTLGWLPKRLPDGREASKKEALPGDLVVMAGGRIGKDGIHGATFSSVELHKDSPTQAVQIGDPITQKKMSDFLLEARDAGLFRAITDNGAGGLSSSIGEMAQGPGGAEIDLARAPLKYAGLAPWEIWLSEAQERMSLAVAPEHWEALAALARRREVEVTVLGKFTADGYIHLKYGDETIGRVGLEFLHEGYPEMVMPGRWKRPRFAEPALPAPGADLTADLRALLGRLNLAGGEAKARQYDHEVKGRTVGKPFTGVARDVPADATIFLAEYGGSEGIVLSRGFNAHLSDLDTYAMMASIIDEAVRRIVAVGGRLDYIAGLDNFCWPDPVESPSTPDGAYKMAQLVRANQALYDTCVAYGVPLISGKDSMKNDSTRGGRKISVPPSVLFSAVGRIDDVTRALTLEAKAAGDLVYVLGVTRAELGASEYAHLLNERRPNYIDGTVMDSRQAIGNKAPGLDPEAALALYGAVEAAARAGLPRSLHAVTLGGLGAALARVAFGGELGLEVDLAAMPVDDEANGAPSVAAPLSPAERLFSESNGRFVATVAPEHAAAFEAALAGQPCARVGVVRADTRLVIKDGARAVAEADVIELKAAWKQVLAD